MIPFEGRMRLQTDPGSCFAQKRLESSFNPGNGQYRNGLVSVASIVSAVIAVIVLFVRVLQPFHRHRPRWMRPFIHELNEKGQNLQTEDKKRFASSTAALLVIIPIGLALQVVRVLYPAYDVGGIFPALAWVS